MNLCHLRGDYTFLNLSNACVDITSEIYLFPHTTSGSVSSAMLLFSFRQQHYLGETVMLIWGRGLKGCYKTLSFFLSASDGLSSRCTSQESSVTVFLLPASSV